MSSQMIKLEWDTEFFKINCAKLYLSENISADEWEEYKGKIKEFDFVVIENANCNAEVSRLIGEDTDAFLIDVNIRFRKNPKAVKPLPNITIENEFKTQPVLAQITEFEHSRFMNDPELLRRNGKDVYYHWLNNSFNKKESFFAIYRDGETILGYILFSYRNNQCILELVNVAKEHSGKGIGSELLKACENHSFEQKCKELIVGTQVKNLNAINFYHKAGFRQISSSEIYHLWVKK